MPHASTEILAIILAGGAGFILAEAVLLPGRLTFKESLKKAAGKAVIIEIGCMVMLLIAGLIEGFISPSTIGFYTRMLWLGLTSLIWGMYFLISVEKKMDKAHGSLISATTLPIFDK